MSGSFIAYAYLQLKQLGEPEIIREINPTVLCAFLKPYDRLPSNALASK